MQTNTLLSQTNGLLLVNSMETLLFIGGFCLFCFALFCHSEEQKELLPGYSGVLYLSA